MSELVENTIMDRSLVYHRGEKEDTKGKSEKSAFK
jgi:hypothetical protein